MPAPTLESIQAQFNEFFGPDQDLKQARHEAESMRLKRELEDEGFEFTDE